MEALKNAVSQANLQLPWCSGVVQVNIDDLWLFYKHNDKASFLSLTDASQQQLDHLSQTCQPATFGLGQQDVLDENYRKACKMDATNFALNFSPVQYDFTSIIKTQLLTREHEKRNIRIELYKLNVYGENYFFKKHKDTPRAENMFGSLVIVLPPRHTGGKLDLNHGDHAYSFDPSALLINKAEGAVAYAAFYSDVEHEVEKVTSGHRITLTYNLYFVDGVSDSTEGTGHVLVDTRMSNSSHLIQQTLSSALDDPQLLSEGGLLCFGL